MESAQTLSNLVDTESLEEKVSALRDRLGSPTSAQLLPSACPGYVTSLRLRAL